MVANQIPSNFVDLTSDFKKYLVETKKTFDDFDKKNTGEKDRIDFINKNKSEIFSKLDLYFSQIDKIIINLENDSLKTFQDFFRAEIIPILGKPEVNHYIFTRPLGYAGDYIMMNFIYDFNDKFYGKTSFDKLINFYTCNIPVSRSNIKRKEFIKEILKAAFKKEGNKIASIGSGPAREIIELFKEGVRGQEITINLLDFENKAFEFFKSQLNSMENFSSKNFKINFINDHIINIFLKKDIREKLTSQNIIYCIGIFDYLSPPIAKRLLKTLYGFLNDKGKLIICNISQEKSTHRSYYEFLGGWEMFHRPKEELLSWAEAAKIPQNFCQIRDLPNDSYNYLIIQKA